MRKILILFCVFIIFTQVSTAQEEGGGGDGFLGSRSWFVSLSPSTSSLIGLKGGLLSNTDGILGGSGIVDALGFYIAGRYNSRDIMNLDRLSVTAGVAPQIFKPIYVYLGGGYGSYKYPHLEPSLEPDEEISGFEYDAGILVKVWKINVGAGVSVLNFEQLDFTVTLGYVF